MKILRTEKFGIFTVVEVQDESGKKAVGISKRSRFDSKNDSLGLAIATGRAKKALSLKLEKKALNDVYKG